ncbi:trehalose-phosphatase [Salinibacterium sp. ZJ454]|uniref:trehalose-phosphatase n=1 Tax=Salinibacterium sp. ZJ454 TaxID=2708339 RepID=UPI001AB01E77|nr:trehalose-phosphatase [Salinibacterium sp. ZJ454]
MTEIVPTPGLGDDLQRLATASRQLLVALDFDGTLAPEVDEPEEARALPAAHAAVLRLLALPRTRVALISGRALKSLEHVSDLPDSALLVGSHGIEIRLDSPDTQLLLEDAERERRDTLETVLRSVAENIDGVWVEEKPAGFALHTRLATEQDSREAHLVALRDTQPDAQNLTVRAGKNVLEFSVRSTTKGESIEHLRRYTRSDAVFFAGDDVTDEDGFAALQPGDFGLKSGPGDTLANHRVAGPIEVAAVLSDLAELRGHATRE